MDLELVFSLSRCYVGCMVTFSTIVWCREYRRDWSRSLLPKKMVLLVAKSDALMRSDDAFETFSLHYVLHRLLTEVDAAGALWIQ